MLIMHSFILFIRNDDKKYEIKFIFKKTFPYSIQHYLKIINKLHQLDEQIGKEVRTLLK